VDKAIDREQGRAELKCKCGGKVHRAVYANGVKVWTCLSCDKDVQVEMQGQENEVCPNTL
jgi:hypothetical protein